MPLINSSSLDFFLLFNSLVRNNANLPEALQNFLDEFEADVWHSRWWHQKVRQGRLNDCFNPYFEWLGVFHGFKLSYLPNNIVKFSTICSRLSRFLNFLKGRLELILPLVQDSSALLCGHAHSPRQRSHGGRIKPTCRSTHRSYRGSPKFIWNIVCAHE